MNLYKGYVPTKDKKSTMPFKGKTSKDLMTLEQVKDLSEYAGVLNDHTKEKMTEHGRIQIWDMTLFLTQVCWLLKLHHRCLACRSHTIIMRYCLNLHIWFCTIFMTPQITHNHFAVLT